MRVQVIVQHSLKRFSMDNVLIISEDCSTVIGCDKSYIGEIMVPEGIVNIGDNAFENCSLSKIAVPLSLKKIGRRAFSCCTNLVEVRLNEGIGDISSYAFAGCNSLSKINLPISLSSIGMNNYGEGSVFSGCISLKSIEIPVGINEIPRETFSGCVNLSSIRIPETIRTIGYDAFDNCVSLQKVIISDVIRWCYVKKLSNPLSNELSNPLSYAHHLYIDDETEIINLELPEKIGSISAHTFENCTGLKSVCFPNGLVDVGHDAFKGCIGIREITLNSENVGEILNEFARCDNVEIINIKHFTPNFCIGLKGFEKLKAVYSISDDGTRTIIDIDNVTNSKAQELKLMSMYYHNLGMNLTMIQGRYPDAQSFKAPLAKDGMLLEELYNSKQKTSTLLRQDWINASGMGLVLGWNDLRALDFDNFTSYVFGDCDYSQDEMRDHIASCLVLLGLPKDYQWVVWSGSKRGFHIIVRIKEFGDNETTPISYSFIRKGLCAPDNQRIELRWKGHIVLPPSIHTSGYIYSFISNQIPTSEPEYVELGKIDNLLDAYCGVNYYKTYNWGERNFEIVDRKKNNTTDSQGVAFYSSWEEIDKVTVRWLEECETSQSYNSLAIKYLLGDGVPSDIKIAYNYFKKADNSQAYFNIASLISIGYFEGTQQEIKSYIDKIKIEDLYIHRKGEEPFPEDDINHKIDRIRKQFAKYRD